MISQLIFKRSLFLKCLIVTFFLNAPAIFGQSDVTRIYTDWNGYWTSNAASGTNNQPDTENNLLAFEWAGKTYATGANNGILTSKSVSFIDTRFRALKIQSLDYTSSTYFLQGSMIDLSLTNRILKPGLSGTVSTPAELAARLTDGINGLSLGTGIANIKNSTAYFKVGTDNLKMEGINDGVPDIVVSQVAQPSSTVDTFKFVDKNGATVGNTVNVAFNGIKVVGTYRLDLFNANNGLPASGFSANDSRDIRLLAMDLTSLGITAANASLVDRFVVTFSGDSDCAFIAFNAGSLKIAELGLVSKAAMLGCKAGDNINYTFEVTNTGESPLTDIYVTDSTPGMVISGNPIANLAVGETKTVTGVYTINASDVTAGKVVESAAAAGKDPSDNTVSDISGQTNGDDIATTTNLLAPPTVGIITNVTCGSQGSVVLSGLPSSSTWDLERTPGSTTTSSGSSATVTGLASGSYTFRVKDNTLGCKSPSSTPVIVTDQSSTTWNGTTWTGGIPDATKNAVFVAPFTLSSDLTACSCTVNSGITVTVPSGNILFLTNAVTNNGGTLFFDNNASLIQTNNSPNINSGNITYKRISTPMNNFDYTYWSSPVTGQTFKDLVPNTLPDKYFRFGTTYWVNELPTAVMDVGRGYIIRRPKPGVYGSPYAETVPNVYAQPVLFVGVPNNGNLTFTVNSAGLYNLIGNPYPSALDANLFLKENCLDNTRLEGTMYFWTHNTQVSSTGYASADYASYNLTGGVGTAATSAGWNTTVPSGNIAAGQSFFILSKNGGDIVFNNSMRIGTSGSNAQFFRGTKSKTAGFETNRVWLNLTNVGGAFKQMLVGYVTGATEGFDSAYDGESFDGNSFVDFYSINENKNLTIQGRGLPFDNKDTVPLGYRTTIDGTFAVSIDNTDGVLLNQAVYVEDKLTNTVHNLKNGPYSFATEKGTFNDRLVLRYTDKTGSDSTLGNPSFSESGKELTVSVKSHKIKINSYDETIEKVTVYDLRGSLLYKSNEVNSNEFTIPNFHSSDLFLIVMTQLTNGKWVTKEIVF